MQGTGNTGGNVIPRKSHVNRNSRRARYVHGGGNGYNPMENIMHVKKFPVTLNVMTMNESDDLMLSFVDKYVLRTLN